MAIKKSRQYQRDNEPYRFDGGFGGADISQPYDGVGQYDPYSGRSDGSGGGGGGTYTPPTPPNNTFVDPSVGQALQNGNIIINLLAESINTSQRVDVEFFENDISKGIGKASKVIYSPAITFGDKKIYKASSAGRVATNYYEVEIVKTFIDSRDPSNPDINRYIPNNFDDVVVRDPNLDIASRRFDTTRNLGVYDFNFDFNRGDQNTPLTRGEQLYAEQIQVVEYKLQDDGSYLADNTETYNSSGDTFNLTFYFNDVRSSDEPPADDIPVDVISQTDYEIVFSTNFNSELNGKIFLEYVIEGESGDVVDAGKIDLQDGAELKPINYDRLKNGKVRIGITGNLPNGFTYNAIYKNRLSGLDRNNPSVSYKSWNTVPQQFELQANELKYGIVVVAELNKEVAVNAPTLDIPQTKFDVFVKESDTERGIRIPFVTNRADSVVAYIKKDKSVKVNATDKEVTLYFEKDFEGVYGSKKVVFAAESNLFGTSAPIEVIVSFIAVNDFPSITEVYYPEFIDVPSFSDFNIDYKVAYNSFSVTSVDVDLRKGDGTLINLFKNLAPNADFKINIKKLRELHPNWNAGDNKIKIVLRPFNRGGAEDLTGNEYEVVTELKIATLVLDETIIESALMQAFTEKIKVLEPEPESKYLTHLLNFGNNEQVLISSWETDNWTLSDKKENEDGILAVVPEKEVKSIILKLYTPLPANISVNSTSWITKLMTNPLVETVILTEQAELKCPPIKGPNFNIEVNFVQGQSIGYESLDDVLLSGSSQNTELVQMYSSGSIIDWSEINVEYASGSNPLNGYIWENFVHYSSAKERLDNFVYKIQLIETYEKLLVSASTDFTGNGGAYTASAAGLNEIKRQNDKKNGIIQSFDGFETFLYNSSSLSWPYTGSVRYASTSSQVINWYASASISAVDYDNNNMNYIINNIPQYISNYENNEQLLLFMTMIGHHFDNIYFYAKSIEKSRQVSYKNKNGVSDKLLFDILKSYSWDAKNLHSNEQLWEYVLGLDQNGSTKFLSPSKDRNYEVWRRILNNLPYLLKHRGTRRGIYALLACYGVPSSNLSILEFGGPEISGSLKGKMVIDRLTTVLNMTTGSTIALPWSTTENSRTPDTFELFIKPDNRGVVSTIAANSWTLQASGSNPNNKKLGKLIWNYGASTLTSNEFPIFGDYFTGIALTKSGSKLTFDIGQYAGERLVFSQSMTASSTWAASTGTVTIGSSTFSGQIDEIRLWSQPLSSSVFLQHAAYPEMINGNNYSSSTDDLFFRVDFEYPKNLNANTYLLNVEPNIFYDSGYTRNQVEVSANPSTLMNSTNASSVFTATVSGFDNITTYPYQFSAYERTVSAPTPSIGASRFVGNKVRVEEQELISQLSPKYRSTIKAYDNAPIDSNRLGLFFSPNKELNLDIIQSFGEINFDNYIGDPSNKYSYKYNELDKLREYYFKRYIGKTRDIYQYINLIKLYEKSMFEDIKQMLPARAKVTTGLLIEPHILERSKYQHTKPTGSTADYNDTIDLSSIPSTIVENNQREALLDASEIEDLTADNYQKSVVIDANYSEEFLAENYSLDADVETENILKLSSLNEPGYLETADADVDTNLDDGVLGKEREAFSNLSVVGQDEFTDLGFGIYADGGHSVRSYINRFGGISQERVLVSVLKEKKEREFTYYVQGDDPRSGTLTGTETYFETRINIQPFYIPGTTTPSSFPTTNDRIVSVTPVEGYLPTHYKYTGDLTTGLQYSYSIGSKNTTATTLDGTPPVEVFATNPNTLKVNKAGRDASEPILEVE